MKLELLWWIAAMILVCFAVAVLNRVNAHTAEQPHADWYNSLSNPTLGHCCGPRDCQPTEWRKSETTGDYEVPFGDKWLDVRPEAVMRIANPTGSAVVCIIPGFCDRDGGGTSCYEPKVRCFVPGQEA